jgi:hypothetical protein
MPLYTFLHDLLNVLAQKKEIALFSGAFGSALSSLSNGLPCLFLPMCSLSSERCITRQGAPEVTSRDLRF